MWHVTLATAHRTRLFPSRTHLYPALHALTSIGGPRLLLFCVVDDHVHVVLRGDRATCGRLAGELSRSIARRSGQALGRTDLRPVDGRTHLLTLVDYLLRQPIRHDLPGHPAAWEGSCFVDLVGARHLPGFVPTAILQELPRLEPSRFWSIVGLSPPAATEPTTLFPKDLIEAAAAALATDPTRRTPRGTDARSLAVRAALQSGFPTRTLVTQLRLARRSVGDLRARSVDPSLETAFARQLALRTAVAASPRPTPTENERRAIERTRLQAGFRDDPP